MADVLVNDASAAVLLALPNWNISATEAPGSHAVISASSAAGVGTPVDYLQDGLPFTWWKSTSGFRRDCIVEGQFVKPRRVGGLALAGADLSTDARLRFRLRWDGDGFQPRTRLAPNAIITQTNLSGGLGDITDDPESPGGTHMTATGSPAVLHVGFATPTNFEQAVPGCHSFRVRLQNTDPADQEIIISEAGLYESGVLRENLLANREGVTTPLPGAGSSDVIYEFIFSPGSLVAPSGANLEFRFVTGDPAGGEARIRAVDLHFEETLPGTQYYDAGMEWAWNTALLDNLGGRLLTRVSYDEAWVTDRAFSHAVRLSGAYANIDNVTHFQVEIHDPWAASVQVAEFPVGESVPLRVRPDLQFGGSGRTVELESGGGQQIFAYRRGRAERQISFLLDRLTGDQLLGMLAERPVKKPFVFAIQPAGEEYRHTRPLYVALGGEVPPLTLYQRDGNGGIWSLTLPLRELW